MKRPAGVKACIGQRIRSDKMAAANRTYRFPAATLCPGGNRPADKQASLFILRAPNRTSREFDVRADLPRRRRPSTPGTPELEISTGLTPLDGPTAPGGR